MKKNFEPSSLISEMLSVKWAYCERITNNTEPSTLPNSVPTCIRTQTMDSFLSAHSRHLPQCQLYADRCPFCSIIVREQTDAYLGLVEEVFRPIVLRYWKRWDASGIHIADNTDPETLVSYLAFSALSRWVQPKFHETVDLTPEEVAAHPIVRQKNGGK